MGAVNTRGVGKDMLLYVPGRVIPAIVQVLTITVLTYFFTGDEIGRYELTFRFVLFLSTGTFLWLGMTVLRFYPAYAVKNQEDMFFGVIGLLKYASLAVGALLATLAYLAGPDIIFGSFRDLIGVGLLMFAAYTFYELGLTVLRAKRRPGLYSLSTTTNALLRLPLAVLLFTAFSFGVSGMLWALAAMYAVVYAALIRRHVGRPHFRLHAEQRALLREVLHYGLPVCGIQMLNYFIMSGDRYLLEALQDTRAVGLYAVACNLIDQPIWLVFQTFTLAVFPTVAHCWETEGRAATEELVGGVTRLFFLMCVPMLVALSVLAKPIFNVLAHHESVQAHVAGPYVATAAFLYGMSYFANMGLHLAKKTRLLLLMTLVALAVNVCANFALLPHFSFVGAAWARIASNAVLVLAVAAAGHRYLRWRLPWKSILRIGLAAAAAGAAAWFAKGHLPVNVFTLAGLFLLGALVYGGLLLVLGEFTREELRGALYLGRNRPRN